MGLETEIPLSNIEYIQIGAEDIEEGHLALDEGEKTTCASPASLYISARELSVRIRLADEVSAAALATDLRRLMEEQATINDSSNLDNEQSTVIEAAATPELSGRPSVSSNS